MTTSERISAILLLLSLVLFVAGVWVAYAGDTTGRYWIGRLP